MASQDETPTHRSTAGGEPLNGTEASAPSQGSTPAGSGSHAVTAPEPAGADEHADWDAQFDNLTGSERADAEAAADEAAAAPEAADDPAVDSVTEDPEPSDAAAPSETGEVPETEEPETGEPETRALPEVPAANPDAAEASGDGGTVPGGHPKVAQRSNLPMRRASTLPDLSGYASATSTDADEDIRTEDRDAPVREAAATGGAASITGESAAASESTESTATAATPVVHGSSAAGVVDADHDDDDRVDHVDDHVDVDVDDDHDDRVDHVDHAADHADVDDDHADDVNDDNDHADDVDPALSAAEAQRRAQEREKAAAGKPVLARVLQVMIAVFFPVMVLAAAIRAVATPLFLWVEYHRPGFPADSYGFSTDDRMTYGSYAVDYLLNWSGSRYLGDLVGDGGEPLYLDSEVSHMADVKTVLTIAFITATVMAVLSLFAALYLSRRSPGGIRRSLFSGAVLTLVLVAALVVLAILGWEQFFTQLHTIFFANGNWTFRLDDTLIRLFPAQFWMDAGITIAALVLLTCTVVLVCCWPTRARRDRVRQAREDARRRYDESLEAL